APADGGAHGGNPLAAAAPLPGRGGDRPDASSHPPIPRRMKTVMTSPSAPSLNPPGAPAISFVIPLYYTGGGVVKLLDAFRNLPPDREYEIVLVNDGSTDDTLQRALEVIPTMPVEVTLVDLARNFGEHAAVLEGFRHVRGRWIVNLDDDLQNPISE